MIISPLLQIFDLFDVKRKGVIDFGDFVRSLNVFHPNASLEEKTDCKSSPIAVPMKPCRDFYSRWSLFYLSYL